MKLYGYWRSSCTWRVRIALSYKGLAYDSISVDLVRDGGDQLKPEFFEKNPLRQVPVLVIDDAVAGEVLISQSMAILEYLEETQPEPALLPSDPLRRAKVRQLAEVVNAGTQPLQNLALLRHLEAISGQEAARSFAARVVEQGLSALEALSRSVKGRFLVGDQPSFADVCLVPQLYNARRFHVNLDAFPGLLGVEEHCFELPAFSETQPSRQPDAPGANR